MVVETVNSRLQMAQKAIYMYYVIVHCHSARPQRVSVAVRPVALIGHHAAS